MRPHREHCIIEQPDTMPFFEALRAITGKRDYSEALELFRGYYLQREEARNQHGNEIAAREAAERQFRDHVWEWQTEGLEMCLFELFLGEYPLFRKQSRGMDAEVTE